MGSDLWPVLEHTHVCGSFATSPHGKNFLSVDFVRCFIWKKWPDSLPIPTYELVAGNIIIILMIIFKLFQEKKLLCGQCEFSKASNGTGHFEAGGNEATYVLSGRSWNLGSAKR